VLNDLRIILATMLLLVAGGSRIGSAMLTAAKRCAQERARVNPESCRTRHSQDSVTRFSGVRFGADYRTRLIAFNGPDPARLSSLLPQSFASDGSKDFKQPIVAYVPVQSGSSYDIVEDGTRP